MDRITQLERALEWIRLRASMEDGPFAAKVVAVCDEAIALRPKPQRGPKPYIPMPTAEDRERAARYLKD